ncbi:nitrate reductase cytochrome c-type subunit, partial [Candidatus Halobeggiatoa sp. HSG11]|nr:nitrate reductase cytochrome c-type subunit [Candidatus Halobeggiatoa sp. HSG11]
IPQITVADDVQSLRGASSIDSSSTEPVMKKLMPESDPIKRAYTQQPPVVPHKTEGYKINLKNNKCLSCHSWENYVEKEATKVSQKHLTDDAVPTVSSKRYFCTQCHVPQVDAKPLVDNTF